MNNINKWERTKLCNVVDFNPTERLPKGAIAKKVSMVNVQTFSRDIYGYEVEPYNGGAKFRNGDTIMARITPCLENGKSAYISFLDNNEVGYGSTEFIVWRAKEGITDNEYIYYLSQSQEIRDVAVKSMVGTSGRQRVQQGVLDNYEINLPPLETQRSIAATLSVLDDKIAVNNKINKCLEEMARAIFKSWFVDFEPWGGVMPDGWCENTLSDITSYCTERIDVKKLNQSTYISTENMLANRGRIVPASSLPTTAKTTMFRQGDVLVSNIRPYFKKIVFCSFIGGCSADVLCFRANKKTLSPFLYWTLFDDMFFDYMVAGSKGTKMPRGDKQQIMNYPIVTPSDDVLYEFNAIVESILSSITVNTTESAQLAELRDSLLPRLMSGEIKVGKGIK